MNKEELLILNLDDRNISLWEEINNSNVVILEPSLEPNYLVNFKENLITIYIDIENVSPIYFAHELLHIKLKNQGVNASKYLNNKIWDSVNLIPIFSKDLKNHIGNCLEHVKMFPLFIDLGYDEKGFLTDFSQRKLRLSEVKAIKLNYKSKKSIDKKVLDYFIGKFFAAKACLSKINYSMELLKLKKIESKLYKILNEFWLDWMDYSIYEPPENYE